MREKVSKGEFVLGVLEVLVQYSWCRLVISIFRIAENYVEVYRYEKLVYLILLSILAMELLYLLICRLKNVDAKLIYKILPVANLILCIGGKDLKKNDRAVKTLIKFGLLALGCFVSFCAWILYARAVFFVRGIDSSLVPLSNQSSTLLVGEVVRLESKPDEEIVTGEVVTIGGYKFQLPDGATTCGISTDNTEVIKTDAGYCLIYASTHTNLYETKLYKEFGYIKEEANTKIVSGISFESFGDFLYLCKRDVDIVVCGDISDADLYKLVMGVE